MQENQDKRHQQRRTIAAGIFVGTLIATGAHAQPAEVPAAPEAPDASAAAAEAIAGDADTAPAPADASEEAGQQSIDEIIVTARRVKESLQVVPASITALNEEMLRQNSIQSTTDLQFMTPGVVFTSTGTPELTLFTIRGQSKSAVGAGLPGVVSYVNDVPLPNNGSIMPTYDLSSAQVLKGPQGTLFGRNTIGGAVLLNTKAPDYNQDGYAQITGTEYSGREFEGATNVTIVDGKAALRLATEIVRRDGYTKNDGVGDDLDNRHSDSVRLSLLLEPFDSFRNVAVLDYLDSDGSGASAILHQLFPDGPLRNPQLAPFFDCGVSVACDIDLQLERQQRSGPRRTVSDVDMSNKARVWGVSNTTTWEVNDSVTLKNIVGYRKSKTSYVNSADGLALAVLNAYVASDEQQLTEEFQILGNAFDKKLNYVAGVFYLKNEPDGLNGLGFDLFRPTANPDRPQIGPIPPTFEVPLASHAPSQYNQNYYTDTSKAIFGQIGYDLSDWVQGLKFNLGARYTEDKQEGCAISTPLADPLVSESGCVDGGGFVTGVKSDATTWTVGFDWQIRNDLFTYITSRRGYRGGGNNAPELSPVFAEFQYFKPETLTDVEIGLKSDWRLGGWVGRLNIAAFHGKYEDIQTVLNLPPNLDGDNDPTNDPASTQLILNNAEATIQGVELSATVSPTAGLFFSVGAAYIDAKKDPVTAPAALAGAVVNNTPFYYTPEWTQSADVRYVHPLDGVGGELVSTLAYYHVGSQYMREPKVDAYSVVNARVEWSSVAGSAIDVGLFARNLFDEEYIAAASVTNPGLGFITVQYGEPRIVGLDLRYRFGK